jgi:methionyl aminopeptidase
LVKIDLVVEKDGYMADAAITIPVLPVSDEKKSLVSSAETAFVLALEVARAGNPVYEIGRVIESRVNHDGFFIVKELTGHGIGKHIHETPVVPNYFDQNHNQILTPGQVITVEPIISMGQTKTIQADDGWTLKTEDGSWAAHHEHTITITEKDPILLTAN